jgi:hypothetical protein
MPQTTSHFSMIVPTKEMGEAYATAAPLGGTPDHLLGDSSTVSDGLSINFAAPFATNSEVLLMDSKPTEAATKAHEATVQEAGAFAVAEEVAAAPINRNSLAKLTKRTLAIVGMSGAFVAGESVLPPVAEAKQKPMSPKSMVTEVRKVEYRLWPDLDPSAKVRKGINVKKATLTANTVTLSGQCDPHNLFEPGIRGVSDTQQSGTLRYCYPKAKDEVYDANGDQRMRYVPHSFIADLKRLGNRAATSATISSKKHGDASKIVASPTSTRISYQPNANAAQNGGNSKQVKTLTLRPNHKPGVTYYSAAAIQAAIAAEQTSTSAPQASAEASPTPTPVPPTRG